MAGSRMRVKNTLTARLKEKKGAFSIIIIALVLIVLFAFSGYSDVLTQSVILNETQQKMDQAALNALNQGVDIDLLREEVLAKNENMYVGQNKNQAVRAYENEIEQAFRQEFNSMMGTNRTIQAIRVHKVKATIDLTDWRTGIDGKETPQIYLDAIIQVNVKVNTQFDIFNNQQALKSVTNAKGNTFNVNVQGRGQDGVRELLIQNSTRLMYN